MQSRYKNDENNHKISSTFVSFSKYKCEEVKRNISTVKISHIKPLHQETAWRKDTEWLWISHVTRGKIYYSYMQQYSNENHHKQYLAS